MDFREAGSWAVAEHALSKNDYQINFIWLPGFNRKISHLEKNTRPLINLAISLINLYLLKINLAISNYSGN
jgi:hypothetical protein